MWVSLTTLMLEAVMVGSGSSGDHVRIHWFTKSESAYLREYACWRCGELLYCSECGRFECFSGCEVPKKSCAFRKEGKVVRL